MKILITGANGFLGKNLVAYLRDHTDHHLMIPDSKQLDLLEESPSEIEASYFKWGPDAIIHLAGVVGGIGFNQNNQGKLGYENLKIGMTVLEAARELKVKKLIMLGTTCSYPHTPKTIPFTEEELFSGMPEVTNSGYGIAKLSLIKLGMDYASQYGLNVVNLIPTNMLGEHDHFEEEKSHVVPALIKKFEKAAMGFSSVWQENYVNIWGNGSASRDFLYVGDCVRAINIALQKDVGPEPINLGSGREVTIKELAEMIKRAGGYDSEIVWDESKPNGQPRRCLDTTRAKNVLKWEATTPLEVALEKSIKWYRENK